VNNERVVVISCYIQTGMLALTGTSATFNDNIMKIESNNKIYNTVY